MSCLKYWKNNTNEKKNKTKSVDPESYILWKYILQKQRQEKLIEFTASRTALQKMSNEVHQPEGN